MKQGAEPLDREGGVVIDLRRRRFCLQACCGLAWLGMAAPVRPALRAEMPCPPVAGIEPEVEDDEFDLSDPGWTY